jgi:hypothetical protein
MRRVGVVVAGVAAALAVGAVRARAQSPPDVQVRVDSPRPYLTLGTDGALSLAVVVSGRAAETFVPTRVFATVGVLELPLPEQATGHFTARYTPPAERYPQVALLVFELANGSQHVRGTARLPLHGTTEVPLRTDPGASVSVRVVDRTFGPVTADRQGHVKIPVEVPPGVRNGIARAVDQHGNLRETDVDLQPTAFPRVLIVAPPTIEAGSFAEVAVLAVDPAGEWVPSPRLSLRASEGLVHPLGGSAGGEATFLAEAPRLMRGGALALTAVAAGTPLARADLAVPLHAGPAHDLALAPGSRRLVIASGGSTQVVVSVHDRFGNPVSSDGAVARIEGQPAPIEITASGQGLLSVPAPARYTGADHLTIDVALGAVRATQELRLTGGPPASISLAVADQRLVADGSRGTELRVHAVDVNGTPTMIPGLSWETPGGRVRNVRMPREGEYLAEFVPARAQDPHRELVAVMASEMLRADGSVEVTPPPPRLVAAARVGVFTSLSHSVGPTAFVEATTPVRVGPLHFAAGLEVGYLRDDVGPSAGESADVAVRLVADQVPVLAVARYRLRRPARPELTVQAGLGASAARTRLTAPGVQTVAATAQGFAAELGADAALPFGPGRVGLGLRYLYIALGRTSAGDELHGNSAGLLADLGYRITF